MELLRRTPDEEVGTQAAGVLDDLVRLRGAELPGEIEAAPSSPWTTRAMDTATRAT